MAVVAQAPVQRSKKIQPLIVRITHWVNAVAMVIMIGSGWRIFNDSPLIPGFIFHPDITLGGDVYLSQQKWQDSGMGGALQWHFAGMWLLVLNGLVYFTYGFSSGPLPHEAAAGDDPPGCCGDIGDALALQARARRLASTTTCKAALHRRADAGRAGGACRASPSGSPCSCGG